MEIAYLFSVRYEHGTSLTLRGVRGTPAVLVSVALVLIAQAAFTYLPPMNDLFESRPVDAQGALVVLAAGVGLLLVVETEKALRRKLIGRGAS